MKKLLGLLIILTGLVIGYFGVPKLLNTSSEVISTIAEQLQAGDKEAVTSKLMDIAELSVMEYEYTNAVKLSDQDRLVESINLPFTKKQIVMTYSGKMKLGVDLKDVSAETTKTDNKVTAVTVTIPGVRILTNEVDHESIEFPVERNPIFNKLESKDYDELEARAKTEIEEVVINNGTLEKAEAELKNALSDYIKGLYGEEVKIEFVKQ